MGPGRVAPGEIGKRESRIFTESGYTWKWYFLNHPGLTVRCELDSADYPKGIVVSDREMDGLNISRDTFHGEWNYTTQPNHP